MHCLLRSYSIVLAHFINFKWKYCFIQINTFLTCFNTSNISPCEFYIVIVGNAFVPIQVWNKYFPVNYFW